MTHCNQGSGSFIHVGCNRERAHTLHLKLNILHSMLAHTIVIQQVQGSRINSAF